MSATLPQLTQSGLEFLYVRDNEALVHALRSLKAQTEIAIDTETAYPRSAERRQHFENIYNTAKDGTAAFDAYTAEVRLIQMRGRTGVPVVIDLWALDGRGVATVRSFFKNHACQYLIANAKFDLKMLHGSVGVWLDQSPKAEGLLKIWDVQQASRLLSNSVGMGKERGHRLADLTRDFLSLNLEKIEQKSDWSVAELRDEQLEYAALDVVHLHELKDILERALVKELKQAIPLQLDMDCLGPTARMEHNGIPVNLDIYHKVQEAARYAMPELLGKIGHYFHDEIGQSLSLAFVEIEKPDGTVEFKPYHLPWGGGKVGKAFLLSKANLVLKMLQALGLKLEDGQPIDNAQKATLEMYRETHPGVGMLVDYWQLCKQAEFNYELYRHPVTGCIHPKFTAGGASTGRFSCTSPNAQQIPGKLTLKHPNGQSYNYRQCFEAPVGELICSADFSGQELNVMATSANCPVMMKTLNEGGDLHGLAAAGMFNIPLDQVKVPMPEKGNRTPRDFGKIINFSLAYGKTAQGFADDWKIPLEEAEEIVANYEKQFPVLTTWLKREGKKGATQNYARLSNGAMRFVAPDNPRDKSGAERAAKNYQIQGMSSWMTRIAMITLDTRIYTENLPIKMIGCIHDELLCQFPYWSGCPYGSYCTDSDPVVNELKAAEKAAKAAKDKDAEKAAEGAIKARKKELQKLCGTTCEGQDCAYRYESIVGECMTFAGDAILQKKVPAAYDANTKRYWSH